jgi:hypothetical protein
MDMHMWSLQGMSKRDEDIDLDQEEVKMISQDFTCFHKQPRSLLEEEQNVHPIRVH